MNRLRHLGLTALALTGLVLSACDTATTGSAAEVRYVVVGAADVTYTDAAGAGQASATGTWTHAFTAAPGATLDLSAVATDGVPVVARIEVNGTLLRADDGLNVRISTRVDDNGGQGEAEVRGVVSARTADRLTVLGYTFVVDGSTVVRDHNDAAIPFSSIAVGEFVEVHGRARGDGTLVATRIEREDGSGSQVEVHGTIEAIDAASVTVRGLRFATDGATRWLDDDNDPIPASQFAVGHFVEAEGFTRGDGTLYAEKVKRDDD